MCPPNLSEATQAQKTPALSPSMDCLAGNSYTALSPCVLPQMRLHYLICVDNKRYVRPPRPVMYPNCDTRELDLWGLSFRSDLAGLGEGSHRRCKSRLCACDPRNALRGQCRATMVGYGARRREGDGCFSKRSAVGRELVRGSTMNQNVNVDKETLTKQCRVWKADNVYIPFVVSHGKRWVGGRLCSAAHSSGNATIPELMSMSSHLSSARLWFVISGPYPVDHGKRTEESRPRPTGILLARDLILRTFLHTGIHGPYRETSDEPD